MTSTYHQSRRGAESQHTTSTQGREASYRHFGVSLTLPPLYAIPEYTPAGCLRMGACFSPAVVAMHIIRTGEGEGKHLT